MFLIKNKRRILTLLSILIFFISHTRGETYDSLLNTIENENISLEKKNKSLNNIYSLSFDKKVKILLALLEKSKFHSNLEEQVKYYSLISQNLPFTDSIDKKNKSLYLDSASMYIEKVFSKEILGIYHYAWGDYYNQLKDFKNAHKHYFQSLDLFGNSNDTQRTAILRNLAFFYIENNDEKSLNTILEEMHSIRKHTQTIQPHIDYYSVLSFYYNCLYLKNNENTEWLDSAIISDQRVIQLYENQENSSIYTDEIAYNYITLANNYRRLKNPVYTEINRLARKASEMARPDDTAMIVNCLWVKGLSLYKLGRTEEAKDTLIKQLNLMNEWSIGDDLEMNSNLLEALSDVHASLDDYKNAWLLQKRKNKIDLKIGNTEKYKAVKELETAYETEKKERKIERQQFTILIILGGTGLLLIVFFFIIRSQRLKKKVIREELKRAQLEKESIENSLKQKDELLKKEKLEKKNIEALIQEKEEALMLTKIENHQIMDLQKNEIKILKYDLKLLQESIRKNESEKETMKTEQDKVIVEITSLIKDRLNDFPDHQKKYLHKLNLMNNAVFILKKKNIQGATAIYCILTALAMEKEHIMLCMNVSDQSVRAKRSEIRKILGISVPTSLEVFLFDLLTTSGSKKKITDP